MSNKIRVLSLFVAAVLALFTSFAAVAQETTSSARVTLYGPDRSPIAGERVRITDTRTGSTQSSPTSESGLVQFRGLPVGGPYTVTVESENYASQTVTDIILTLGDTYDVVLELGSASMEEVIVTAAMIETEQLAIGPSSSFGIEDLNEMPHFERDLRDIIRADPRLYVDPTFAGGAVQCAGANPRFNSLTVDGVRLNDLFGLNSNGYPTERQPFPYSSIEQVAVELAPYDVYYGGFTACNVNAVTKSGSNEWSGSAFFDYTNDNMKGDKLQGDKIDNGNYSEKRYGATLGGPIMKDKLFFFVAYEKLEGAQLFDRVPTGAATSGRVIQGVSQEQLDQIYEIAETIFGYTPGPLVRSLPVEDDKLTVKLDWDISENHRATFSYNYNDGYSIAQADDGDNAIESSDHYYERGAELNSYTGALFSNWTDAFSTEARISYLKLDNRQISRNTDGVGEIQVETWNDADGDGQYTLATVFLGTDDSRQSNDLNYDDWSLKLAGNYALDDHYLTFGYERDDLSVFNLFIQHTIGEYRNDAPCGPTAPNGCILQFQEARPNRIDYGNAVPTNNPIDGAADWGYVVNTAYLQDEMVLAGGDLTLVFGLRYEWYASEDEPAYNPFFFARNGFANTATVDGLGLIEPRFGFNWTINPDLSLRGGVGLYSGGNPNVWLSNNFSNDGIRIAQLRESLITRPVEQGGCGAPPGSTLFTIPLIGEGRPYFDIPACLYNAIANQTPNSGVNALDPAFDLPENWKLSLGSTWFFGDGYTLNADLLFSKANNSALVVGETMVETSLAPDGRPIYTDPRAFNTDYVLTNVQGSDAKSTQFAVSLSKDYDNGLFWSLGYAYTNAKDVNPMTSSVAFSNYANIAVYDPNNPGLAPSNYDIPHRLTWRLEYQAYWWKDNRTTFSLFGSANQGKPFSYTFARDDGNVFGDFVNNRHLLYVPTGPADPLVVFADTFNQQAFFDFVDREGLDKYAGRITGRNAFLSNWWASYDLRIEQEFPGFGLTDKFAAFLTVKNFCNLLNNNWCVLEEVSFPLTQPVVDMALSADKTQYIYQQFIAPTGQVRAVDPSLWELRIGVTYRF